MYRYLAYGLIIDSARELPFFPSDAAAPDVTFQYEPRSNERAPASDGHGREFSCSGEDWSLRYLNPAGGWIGYEYKAAEAVLRVSGNASWDEVEMALIGVVCAVLLARKGRTLLHGAAVAWEDRAVAILGDSGSGKSSLAACLLREGGRLLSEDLILLEEGPPGIAAQAGYGRISLFPDSVGALGMAAGQLRARPGSSKSWIDTEAFGAVTAPSVPLVAIYILGDFAPGTDTTEILPIPGRGAAMQLMRHLYGSSWIREVAPGDVRFCAAVGVRVPVFRLVRPRGLGSVPAAGDMIRAHAAQLFRD